MFVCCSFEEWCKECRPGRLADSVAGESVEDLCRLDDIQSIMTHTWKRARAADDSAVIAYQRNQRNTAGSERCVLEISWIDISDEQRDPMNACGTPFSIGTTRGCSETDHRQTVSALRQPYHPFCELSTSQCMDFSGEPHTTRQAIREH